MGQKAEEKQSTKQARWKKEAEKEKAEEQRDHFTYRTYCRVLQGLSPWELQHTSYISWPEFKNPPARKTDNVHVIACLLLHVLCARMSVCLCLCPVVCTPLQCVLYQEVVLSPSVWHWRVQSPRTSAWNKPPLCFPSSFSFCISYHVSPGNTPPPFLPPSRPHPSITAVWAFITPLPPSSFYLSVRMKESVKEYVRGGIPYVCIIVLVCVCLCAPMHVCVYMSLCASVFVYVIKILLTLAS